MIISPRLKILQPDAGALASPRWVPHQKTAHGASRPLAPGAKSMLEPRGLNLQNYATLISC